MGVLNFDFPPPTLGWWRTLSESQRVTWLQMARRRFFGGAGPSTIQPGRIVVLDGDLVNSLSGFFCMAGEVINGPGGYFGGTLEAFDDCLFSGFGLEYPYTVVVANADQARAVLNSRALLAHLREADPVDEEARAWCDEWTRLALAEKKTLFDLIVESISTVSARGGGAATVVLKE